MDSRNKFFDEIQNFDVYKPRAGHRERFAKRLKNQNKFKVRRRMFWIAAAVLILFLGLSVDGYQKYKKLEQQALMKPEIRKTQDYFAGIIEQELESIQTEETPESRKLVAETMYQLKKLERDYDKLLKDFRINNENKALINAMIENFRQRIQLLEFTKQQLEEIKKIKNTYYEQGQI